MTDMSVREKKKAETRQLLMAAGVQVFHESGIHDTRVSDIVARAGVAQGTFYNHFQSKEALFRAMADEYMAHYVALFHHHTAGLFKTENPAEMVNSFVGFLRQLFINCQNNIATARLVFGEGAGSVGPYQEICDSVVSRFISLIKSVLDEGNEKGLIRIDDTELAAAMVFGLFQRCMFYFLLTKKEFDVDRIERGMTAFMLEGLNIQIENQ